MIGCGLTAMIGCGKGDSIDSKGSSGSPDAASRADAAVPRCGDGTCSTSEIGQCAVDCGGSDGGGSGGTCNNDGTCDNAEINQTPPCADCASQVVCDGDGTCESASGENSQNCASDCPPGPCNNNGTCDTGEDGSCADCASMPAMCTTDAQCTVAGQCCLILANTCGKGTVTPLGCLPI
jgi:hypothetical protein